jgi:hypothetical protein
MTAILMVVSVIPLAMTAILMVMTAIPLVVIPIWTAMTAAHLRHTACPSLFTSPELVAGKVCGDFCGRRADFFRPPPFSLAPPPLSTGSAQPNPESKIPALRNLDPLSSFPQPLFTTTAMLYSGLF